MFPINKVSGFCSVSMNLDENCNRNREIPEGVLDIPCGLGVLQDLLFSIMVKYIATYSPW